MRKCHRSKSLIFIQFKQQQKTQIVFFKENDRTILVEQYREASNDLSRTKITLTDLESQVNNLRQELQIKAADNKRLAEHVDYLERELQKVVSINIKNLFRNFSLASACCSWPRI